MLVVSGTVEPIETTSSDEAGQLAQILNEAAMQLRRDIERLSGLYHISLMMGTDTEVSRICELLTRKVARLLGADMGVILLHDERRLHRFNTSRKSEHLRRQNGVNACPIH